MWGSDDAHEHESLSRYGFFADPVGTRAAAAKGMAEYAPPTVTNRKDFSGYYPDCAEILDIMSGDKGGAIFEAMRKTLTTRPYTLVHGDLRCDNVFKPKK